MRAAVVRDNRPSAGLYFQRLALRKYRSTPIRVDSRGNRTVLLTALVRSIFRQWPFRTAGFVRLVAPDVQVLRESGLCPRPPNSGRRVGTKKGRRPRRRRPVSFSRLQPRAHTPALTIAPPSMSGWLISSWAFSGFMLPPYWMRMVFAVSPQEISASVRRISACTSCA